MSIQPSILNLMTSQCRNTYTTHALKIKNTMDKQLESLYFQWNPRKIMQFNWFTSFFIQKPRFQWISTVLLPKPTDFPWYHMRTRQSHDHWLLTPDLEPWPLAIETSAWGMAMKAEQLFKTPIAFMGCHVNSMEITWKSTTSPEKCKESNSCHGEAGGIHWIFHANCKESMVTCLCSAHKSNEKPCFFFFGAARLFCLWNTAKSCFSMKKAQLELPTPHPLHPPPLISIVFFYKISRTRTKKSFLKIQTQTWAHELPDMQPPWKYSVFLWFWLCFRTRISETLHFLRISCPGGHPQVRGGVGFSKLSMGPLFFLHTPCFHKLLLRFSHYPKQASEPGREPWPWPS